MKLLLIRHGESEADLLGVHEGRADFPLTALGKRQAELMAMHVAERSSPQLILTSPLKRARKTAAILNEKLDCELIEEPLLKEFNNGVLAGLSREEAAIKFPLPEGGRPIHVPIQDGESELNIRFRAESVLSKILVDYQENDVVVLVSHGGLLSHLLNSFLRQPIHTEFIYSTGDTGIHLIETKNQKRIVRFLNKQEHLIELKYEEKRMI